MEDKLVTVAIHSYERAIILKGILESEGIEVYLHNINEVQPMISAGVRVRIKESDLATALMVIEKVDFGEKTDEVAQPEPKRILVPVDFSDYSIRAARFAFRLAKNIDASIVILHTYYSPYYTGGMPISDAIAFDENSEKALRMQQQKNKDNMDQLTDLLRKDIASGLLPDIPFITKFREGVPEEQILIYSKKHKPFIIMMGSRGKDAKEASLMGSVTAEVIDRSLVPVFAFPENTPIETFEEIQNIAFITNFDQRDLMAFESMMLLMKNYKFKVCFIHLSSEHNAWNEIQIAGIKEYFCRNYPDIESTYCVIDTENMVKDLDQFITNHQIDVLTVISQKRNIFARLFNPSIAHKMIFHSDTPLLVLKG